MFSSPTRLYWGLSVHPPFSLEEGRGGLEELVQLSFRCVCVCVCVAFLAAHMVVNTSNDPWMRGDKGGFLAAGLQHAQGKGRPLGFCAGLQHAQGKVRLLGFCAGLQHLRGKGDLWGFVPASSILAAHMIVNTSNDRWMRASLREARIDARRSVRHASMRVAP
eukprot:356952-Chlamydomonas_euryale.AAC.1